MDDYQSLIKAAPIDLIDITSDSQTPVESIEFETNKETCDYPFQDVNDITISRFSQPRALSTKNEYINIDSNSAAFFNQTDYLQLNGHIVNHVQNNFYNEDDSDDCVITGESQSEINQKKKAPIIPSKNVKRITATIYNDDQLNCNTNDIAYVNYNGNIGSFNLQPDNYNFLQEYIGVNTQAYLPNYNPEEVSALANVYSATNQIEMYQPINSQEAIFVGNPINQTNNVYNNYNMNVSFIPQNTTINAENIDMFSLPTETMSANQTPVIYQDVPTKFRNIQPSNAVSVSKNNYISPKINVENNLETRIKFNQEMKRKRKLNDSKLARFKGVDLENNSSQNEVLIGLTWRHGPASYWYDLYNVPYDEEILKYRITPTLVSEDEDILPIINAASFTDEDCKMSTWQLVCWEDDVIIDPESSKCQILESNKKYACQAGWIPSSNDRDLATFQDAICGDFIGIWPSSSTGTRLPKPDVTQWHSIFNIENSQILDSAWISKIIIDPRQKNAQEPYLLELDLNNECIHFDFTNPKQTKEILSSEMNNVYLKSTYQLDDIQELDGGDCEDKLAEKPPLQNSAVELKKLKILGKFSEVQEVEKKDKEPPIEKIEKNENVCLSLVKYCDQDTYIFVNDPFDNEEFSLEPNITHTLDTFNPLHRHGVQHSLSAIQLDSSFFPLKLENSILRQLHRPKLGLVKNPMIPLFITPQPIFNIVELVKQQSEERRIHCQLTGSGDLFFMRSIADLSASIDHIVLAEYCEEYPPLMSQVGMASRITNYFSGRNSQLKSLTKPSYGELCITPKIPFLGQLSRKQIFQALENNMFRAPVYPHKLKPTDFLVIIKSGIICIRRVTDIFVVGQELPLMEVPAPNSKKVNTFVRDFLQVQIIRVFLQSQTNPKSVRHDEIKARFTAYSDSVLRQRLKVFAEFRKDFSGNVGYWVLKPEYHLPTEEELTELLTPEECCAYYSMIWGLCRLEDAGYNSKSFIQGDPDLMDDDDEKESLLKIEDEVKAAPWHTTRTFLGAQKGKFHLELLGSTDPTGIGEAFSYSRINTKAAAIKNKSKKPWTIFGIHAPAISKRLSGTDADLRRLTNKKAYSLLKECGVSGRYLKKLKRWDIIDLVRQMSTLRANHCDEESLTKYARSAKTTFVGHEEKYKSECQRIFSLQNQVLSNDEELSTDDESSEEEDENADMNDEEREVLRIKMIFDSQKSHDKNGSYPSLLGSNKSYRCTATPDNAKAILKFKPPMPKAIPKGLCIRRQVELANGSRTTHCQTIPWSTIVKIYFKMNEEHKKDYLRNFCGLNEKKEEPKKPVEKKRKKTKLNTKINRVSAIRPKPPVAMTNIRRKIAAVQLKVKCKQMENLTPKKRGRKSKKQFPMLVNPILPFPPLQSPIIHSETQTTGLVSLPPIPVLPCTSASDLSLQIEVSPVCLLFPQVSSPQIDKINPSQSIMTTTHSPSTATTIPQSPLTYTTLLPPQLPSTVLLQSPLPPISPTLTQLTQFPKVLPLSNQLNYVPPISTPITPLSIPLPSVPPLTSPLPSITPVSSPLPSAIPLSTPLPSVPPLSTPLPSITPLSTPLSYMVPLSSPTPSANHASSLSSPKFPVPCSLPTTPLLPPSAPSTPDDHNKVTGFSYQTISRDSSINGVKEDTVIVIDCDEDEQPNTTPAIVKNGKRGRKPLKSEDEAPRKRKCTQTKWVQPPTVEQKSRGTRRCIDPRVGLNHQFEEIYKGLLQVPGYRIFLHAVRKKDCPKYSSVISKPMDLSIIKMKINKNAYDTRVGFLEDIKLIFDNSLLFSGDGSEQTIVARHLMSYVMEQFCVKERKLMRLEKLANPLMDDDDMVGFRYILEQTVVAMEDVEYSRAFHKPVDRKKYFDYGERVRHPMDLQTLRSNIRADKYHSRDEFLVDANLILSNCVLYNGEDSPLTTVAQNVIAAAHRVFQEREETFLTLERSLRSQLDDASGSQVTALSHTEEETVTKQDDHRERLRAALELTDSEDEAHGDGAATESGMETTGANPVTQETPGDGSTAFEDRSNNYYNQSKEENSLEESQEDTSHVTFYISDDD